VQAYSGAQIVYMDEAGVDDCITYPYPYGYCHRSEHFHAVKLGHKTQCISMVAGWCQGEIIAPMTFEGYCDTTVIELWVAQMLAPALKPGQIVLMDNASFHKSPTIRQLIEQVGAKLIFCPPIHRI
jgi:DDE superfamily endonuclease